MYSCTLESKCASVLMPRGGGRFLNIADFDKDAALALRDDDVNMLFTPSPYNFWTPEVPQLRAGEATPCDEVLLVAAVRFGPVPQPVGACSRCPGPMPRTHDSRAPRLFRPTGASGRFRSP